MDQISHANRLVFAKRFFLVRILPSNWAAKSMRQRDHPHVSAKDTAAIEQCDFLIAVLDGRTVDEGVAFELGYARALGKTCLGFKSDDRVMVPTGDNPMLGSACHYRASSVDMLIDHVRCLLNGATTPQKLREKVDIVAPVP